MCAVNENHPVSWSASLTSYKQGKREIEEIIKLFLSFRSIPPNLWYVTELLGEKPFALGSLKDSTPVQHHSSHLKPELPLVLSEVFRKPVILTKVSQATRIWASLKEQN